MKKYRGTSDGMMRRAGRAPVGGVAKVNAPKAAVVGYDAKNAPVGPMSVDPKVMMPKGPMSTQSAGPLTEALRMKLTKEAPETLRAPRRKEFTDADSHAGAMAKFKKFGHWASKD